MIVKKDSKLVWLQLLMYGIDKDEAYNSTGKLSKSLCGFFWASVLAVLMIPINIPGILIGLCWFRDNPGGNAAPTNPLMWALIQLVCGMSGGALLLETGLSVYIHEAIFSKMLISMLFGALVIGTAFIFIWLCVITFVFIREKVINFISTRNISRRQTNVTKPNLTVEFIKAKKNKVCPIIEYED